MIQNLNIHVLHKNAEITGEYNQTAFYLNVEIIGEEEPELYFNEETFYTLGGEPKLLRPQTKNELIEVVSKVFFESQEYQSMLRDWNILHYNYKEYLNDY